MSLEIIHALHRIERAVPYAYVVLLCVVSILVTWRVTLAIARRDHEKWLHMHGDKALRDKLVDVRTEKAYLQKELSRVNRRMRGTHAAVRGLHMALAKVHELLQLADDNSREE